MFVPHRKQNCGPPRPGTGIELLVPVPVHTWYAPWQVCSADRRVIIRELPQLYAERTWSMHTLVGNSRIREQDLPYARSPTNDVTPSCCHRTLQQPLVEFIMVTRFGVGAVATVTTKFASGKLHGVTECGNGSTFLLMDMLSPSLYDVTSSHYSSRQYSSSCLLFKQRFGY
jgi:hypothetical protein